MVKNTQAIRPDVFTIKDFIREAKEKDIDELTEDEKILASGADQRFWLILKEHINNQLAQLDRINEDAISNGMSFEEIGRNTLVTSYVKGIVESIFSIVEDAKEELAKTGS